MSSSAQRTDMAKKCRSASHAYYVSKLVILRARDRLDLVCRNLVDSFCSNQHKKVPSIRVRNIWLRWIRFERSSCFYQSSVIQTADTLSYTMETEQEIGTNATLQTGVFLLIFLLQTHQLPRCQQFGS